MSTENGRGVAHQPDIPGEVLAIFGMVSNIPGVDVAVALAVAISALDGTSEGFTPDCRAAARVAEGLTKVYGSKVTHLEAKPTTASLDDVVASLRLKGVDGESLVWSVIRYEAQFHTKLIWLEANRMAKHFDAYSAEDLAGWGWLGLRQAMRQFDARKGFKFSTYACHRIKGSIRDGVRDENPIPKRLLTLQRKVSLARAELRAALDREPTVLEIAEMVEEEAGFLARILPRLEKPASIVEMEDFGDGDANKVLPQLVDNSDPADQAFQSVLASEVELAMKALDREVEEVLRMVIWDHKSIADVRRETGKTDREVRKIIAEGQKELASSLSQWREA